MTEQQKHTVQHGETLSGIAQAYYGDGSEQSWRRIYRANKHVIGDNPDVIKAGETLTIPPHDPDEPDEAADDGDAAQTGTPEPKG
jgi:nucleoid-associated protein YgaU